MKQNDIFFNYKMSYLIFYIVLTNSKIYKKGNTVVFVYKAKTAEILPKPMLFLKTRLSIEAKTANFQRP